MASLAANMAKLVEDEHAYYHVVRVVMLSFIKGISPILAVEMGRRAIPEHLRPSFQDLSGSRTTCSGSSLTCPFRRSRCCLPSRPMPIRR